MTRVASGAVRTSVAQFSGTVTAAVASTAVRPANPDRIELVVVNDGDDPVYLQLATSDGVAPTAAVGQGLRLNAGGGSWSTTTYTGAVAAIADGAPVDLTVCEV